MFVFVTKNSYAGNDIGDIGGANAKCQQEADAAGLPGTYFAWITKQEGISPDKRFIKSYVSPYVLPNGMIIANNWDTLAGNPLDDPITFSADMTPVNNVDVWTNTESDGNKVTAASGQTCGGWTGAAPPNTAYYGDNSQTDNGWTNTNIEKDCAQTAHLYCFRQAIE